MTAAGRPESPNPAVGKPLALSLGDPAGIGPEIVAKAWTALRKTGPAFVVVGDRDAVAAAMPVRAGGAVRRVSSPLEGAAVFADALPVIDLPLVSPVVSGQASPAHAQAIIRWIETAVGLALSGAVSGVVTAPIAKAPLYAAGFGFPGHTEFLAELTGGAPYEGERGPVMMLATPQLRTVLVTIHQPLRQAISGLSSDAIVRVGRVAAQAMQRDFGIASPRLALAGLNPHAGEGGTIGREEVEIINPAAARLRALGIDCPDARPADSRFHADARATYDVAVCLYHDQALIPVKTLDFWNGVNATLGLLIVRTSPDHGVGYDIAGRGLARPDSLIAAIRMAAEMAAAAGDVSYPELDALPPLREALADHGLLADKRFGQHFLLDLNLTRKIARIAAPLEDTVVIEVGPGPGGLTRALLAEGAARVIAIERDPRFIPLLQEVEAASNGRLTLIQGDALKVDEAALVAEHAPGLRPLVISNLPYNVGTPLLVRWLTGAWRPVGMALMFQREVADRIVAPVGSEAYGRLSVLAQATSEARLAMTLPSRAFTPPPKVDSAVVALTPRADAPSGALLAALERVTGAAFGQRRKMLRSSLKPLGGAALCEAAGIEADARAEVIDVAGFLRLAASTLAHTHRP